MIGELEIIFGLDTIPIQGRVLRQLAVFLQHLWRIAPGPAVDPVELAATLRTIVAATATAVIVVATNVVIQGKSLPQLGPGRQTANRSHVPAPTPAPGQMVLNLHASRL
jgi:hypothetical protein